MVLRIPPDVLRQFAKLPKDDRKRIREALELIAADPAVRQSFVTEMVGHPGVWRARKGDWRAVFRFVDGDVVVDRVGHRSEVYR